MTVAPFFANWIAAALPMPLEAPVIWIVLFLNVFIVLIPSPCRAHLVDRYSFTTLTVDSHKM
jgi:hypothetical protein